MSKHHQNKWTVALVGRTNVGKSTLFNRLSTRVKSLTLDQENVTRDVLRDSVSWQGKHFQLVDTGGINVQKSHDAHDVIAQKVKAYVLDIIEKADIIVLVIDGTVGPTMHDKSIAQLLHKLNKQVIVAVNKSDSAITAEHIPDANKLGFAHVIPISATHGTGTGQLLEVIVSMLPEETGSRIQEPAYKVLLLGRPNVGKSSLMNAVLNYERSIVADVPGTTREPISEPVTFYKQHLTLTDTPGIRRKRGVTQKLESMMVHSAFNALKDSDIVVLLIDVTEGALVDQDLKLAFYAFTEQYKSLILAINKTDIATPDQLESLDYNFKQYKHLISKVPVLSISCVTGKNVGKLLPLIQEVWERSNTRFTEAQLSMLFLEALKKKPLMYIGHKLTVSKAYQVKTAPITIVLESTHPQWFGPSQLAFFENLLRKEHDLTGAPVHFIVRKKRKKPAGSNPG